MKHQRYTRLVSTWSTDRLSAPYPEALAFFFVLMHICAYVGRLHVCQGVYRSHKWETPWRVLTKQSTGGINKC